MRVPWTARRSNQSILKEIGRTDTEAEAPNFGHLMQRTDSLEKTPIWGNIKAGGEEDDRG